MRSLYAILLLGCFCLYYLGFTAYFFAIQNQVSSHWEESIWEDKYDTNASEMMKIPLSLPYMANQEEFQTTNFSIEKDGRFIRVIKQRYQNDTLEIVYLPDVKQQKFHNQLSDWIKSMTDRSASNNQEQNQLFLKFYPKDFISNELTQLYFLSVFNLESSKFFLEQNHSDFFADASYPPPELV